MTNDFRIDTRVHHVVFQTYDHRLRRRLFSAGLLISHLHEKYKFELDIPMIGLKESGEEGRGSCGGLHALKYIEVGKTFRRTNKN